jgi:acyl-coenzyme A synthetase/AMP-(fatty) acid ligase
VLEAAVVGVPDDVWSERIAACILPVESVDGSAPTEAELQDWCRARLASHKVPKQVVCFTAAEWPRLENGKVPKRLLRDRLTKQASPA